MRLLEAEEINGLNNIINEAVEQARKSPCQKSQRGAVIFRDGEIIGKGFNTPPRPLKCDGRYCWPICSQFAIHAEQNAIYDALLKGRQVAYTSIFHIKVHRDAPCPTNKLSCAECSKLVLRLGLREFILFQDQGYVAYSAIEFHNLTLEYLRHQHLKQLK